MSIAHYYYMETMQKERWITVESFESVMKVAFFDFVNGKNIPRKIEYENKIYKFVDMCNYWAKRGWLQAWINGKEVRV
jgi:hypothetical protein